MEHMKDNGGKIMFYNIDDNCDIHTQTMLEHRYDDIMASCFDAVNEENPYRYIGTFFDGTDFNVDCFSELFLIKHGYYLTEAAGNDCLKSRVLEILHNLHAQGKLRKMTYPEFLRIYQGGNSATEHLLDLIDDEGDRSRTCFRREFYARFYDKENDEDMDELVAQYYDQHANEYVDWFD